MPKTNLICLTPLLPPLSLSLHLHAEQRRNEIRHVKKSTCACLLFSLSPSSSHIHSYRRIYFEVSTNFYTLTVVVVVAAAATIPPEFVSSWNFDSGNGFTFLWHTHTLVRSFRISFLYTFFENIYRKRQTKKKELSSWAFRRLLTLLYNELRNEVALSEASSPWLIS